MHHPVLFAQNDNNHPTHPALWRFIANETCTGCFHGDRDQYRPGMDAAFPTESTGIQAEQEDSPTLNGPQQPSPYLPPPDRSPDRDDDAAAAPTVSDTERAEAAASPVTPQEVLTLGVLALAGLWPGCWSGIAAIISHKAERLAQRGAVDAPFRRCARTLVDMLLQSPGKSHLAAETLQQIASAQADLPDELGEMLGLACSLLQHRSFETADTRAKRKRRRSLRLHTLAALTAPISRLPPVCATALANVVSDVARDEEEQEMESRRKRQREMERLAAPPLLPPSRVLPLLLQQPVPPSAATAQPSQERPPAPPPASSETEAVQPVQPDPPHLLDAAAPPVLGGTEAEFPVLLHRSATAAGVPSPTRPAASVDTNGDHRGVQESPAPSPPPSSPEQEQVVVD